MGKDLRALQDPPSPSPGDEPVIEDKEPEPGEQPAPTTEEPVAGEITGEAPQPGADDAARVEAARKAWDELPPFAREEILKGRRAARRVKEAALQAGWTIDETTGEFIPPAPAPRREEPRVPEQPATKTGLPAERERYFAQRFREAELADDPVAARMEVSAEMGGEIADQRLRRGLDIVLPATIRGTVESYKEAFRKDPQRGEAFKLAETEFDQVVKEAVEQSRRDHIPFIASDELMGYLRGIAIDRALPKILATTGTRRDAQRTGADRVTAAGPRVAGAERTPTPGPTAPQVTTEESKILGSLARGSGLDEKKLTTGYANRKSRGE